MKYSIFPDRNISCLELQFEKYSTIFTGINSLAVGNGEIRQIKSKFIRSPYIKRFSAKKHIPNNVDERSLTLYFQKKTKYWVLEYLQSRYCHRCDQRHNAAISDYIKLKQKYPSANISDRKYLKSINTTLNSLMPKK